MRILGTFLVILLACGCSGDPEPTSSSAADAGVGGATARTLPVPGQQAPPGHPPSGGAGRLVWSVPPGWVEQPPPSRMRYAQYAVDGPGGPGECIVYYFGPSQGGDAASNAQRWAGQFSQPDGRSSLDLMTMTPLGDAAVPLQLVEVSGTYDGGMTMTDQPGQPRQGYMLLGGIAEGPDAPWFFKFTGPEATVQSQREAFIQMMTSIRAEG